MASSVPALVEPSVLRWARQSIGLTPLAAARKIGVPADRVERWEAGTAQPTVAQLREAARVYKRPLAVFFLSEPPTDFDAMHDFRRLPDSESRQWSAELHGEFRRALRQRDNALELFELEDLQPADTWQVEAGGDDDEVASSARRRLLDVAPLPLPESAATAYEHLNAWVAAVEEAGVLVLASERGAVSVQEMRAFSVYFDVLPVITLNGADGPRGRTFSLLHELSHLLLRTSGLCDVSPDERSSAADQRLEARCNRLAASILMPSELVMRSHLVMTKHGQHESWDYASLREAAAPFGVSAEAFLRRLASLGEVPMSFYLSLRAEFRAAYDAEVAQDKGSGGTWYRNTARDRGKAYVRRVADAHRRRVIDSYTAASYLDVKVGQIPRLAEEAALKAPVQ